MGYTELRILRELQNLKREAKEARSQERRTREGCMGLLQALEECMANLAVEGAGAPVSARFGELLSGARTLLEPTPDSV